MIYHIRLPRLIAFDLDGTLAVSKSTVSQTIGSLLARLLAKVSVAIISGASFAQFEKQVLTALPSEAHRSKLLLFPTNASMCYQYKNGNWERVYDLSFSDAERAEITTALTRAMIDTGFSKPPAQVWGERVEDRGSQITFSGLGQEAPPDEKKKWDPNERKRMPLWKELTALLPGFSVRMNAASSIDITRKGVTKAYGVRKLFEITGIPISDMLYIGDALFPGGNDEVVKETGIATREVTGPEETASVIRSLLENV